MKKGPEFLKSYFTAFEEKNKALLDEKIERYNAYWQEYEPQIVDALSEAFATDLSGLFNDLVCNMGFSPICPRFLDKNSFNNFYLESEKGALGTSMHEIIHFVWFYVWQKHFGDDPEEYETPHLKWILSEMVVEPIMRDPRLCSINPYFADNAAVYPYFYTFKIDGKPVLDLLYEMLGSMPIEEFMEQSYRLCLEHEDEIRKHIEENENA